MTEYHTIYKGPEGESTKWDDIQRKLGNKPPKVGAQAAASRACRRCGALAAAGEAAGQQVCSPGT